MLRCLGLRHVYRLGRTCTVRPGAGSGLSGVVPRGEGRLSCTAFLQEDTRWSQPWRCTTVRGFTAARAKTVKPKEAQRVVVPPVDPSHGLDSSEVPPTREGLTQMLQAGGGVSSWQATAVTEWFERYAQLGAPERRRLLPSEGLSVLDRAMALVGQQGARKDDKGGDVFTPSLGARLVHAFARDLQYAASKPNSARLRALGSQIASFVTGDEAKGLRKLTGQQLARFAHAVAHLLRRDSSKTIRHVEVECLRRGLDKFKAADLADLLDSFHLAQSAAGKELVEAACERMVRRGYLTKGRGGETSPQVVVRLLEALATSPYGEAAFWDRVNDEVVMRTGFLAALTPQELARVLRVEVVRGRESGQVAKMVLNHLADCCEVWAGREGLDMQVLDTLRIVASHVKPGDPFPEHVAVWGRLLGLWARRLEAGQPGLSDDPWALWLTLEPAYIRNLLDGDAARLFGPIMGAELARLLRVHGLSCFTKAQHMAVLCQVFQELGHFPGDALVDSIVRRYEVLLSADQGELRLENVHHVVAQAVKPWGRDRYVPGPGIADVPLRMCLKADLGKPPEVSLCASVVEKLYMGLQAANAPPQSYPSQPLVEAILPYIQARIASVPQDSLALPYKFKAAAAFLTGEVVDQGGGEGERGEGEGGEGATSETQDMEARAREAEELGRLSDGELAERIQDMLATLLPPREDPKLAPYRALGREATRPARLENMDNPSLLAVLRAVRRLWYRGMGKEEAKATLEAWTHEVRMRGIAQVAPELPDLALIIQALGDAHVELDEGLVLGVLHEVDRLGLQTLDGAVLDTMLRNLLRLPRARQVYGPTVQAILIGTPPRELSFFVAYAVLKNIPGYGFRPSDAYLEELQDALAAGLEVAPWSVVCRMLYSFRSIKYPPSAPLLRAVEQALLHGHPLGQAALQSLKDEEERRAAREAGLRYVGHVRLQEVTQAFQDGAYKCDDTLLERLEQARVAGDLAILPLKYGRE